jgi:hypothetical protein
MNFLSCASTSIRIVQDTVRIGDVDLVLADRSVRGMDDPVYESDRSVWEAVPRGDTTLSIGGTVVHHVVGLRKFGYAGAPYGRASDVSKVVTIAKENGECAHISAFTAGGIQYWVAGSKHVHIVWRVGHYHDDIVGYTAPRYTYALKVARLWHTMITGADVDAVWFFTLLDGMRATACAEAILADSEHIVEYADGEKDTLKFYAIAEPRDSRLSLCCPPSVSYTIFTRCGLPTAVRSAEFTLGSAEYVAELDRVARLGNSEGVVVYGLDSYGHVVCMWKEKSYPYVMERVVREATIHGRTLPEIRDRVARRLAEQDASVRAYFTEWESVRFPWLLEFAGWLRATGVLPVRDAWAVQSRWLTLQRTFRALSPEERAMALSASLAPGGGGGGGAGGKTVVVFVGLPCSGKSTLARGLLKLLTDQGHVARWLNQDEAECNRHRFLNAVKAVAEDPSVTHILLDKANLGPSNRKDYTDLGLVPTHTVILMHPDGVVATKAVCVERFAGRGEGHRSLRSAGASAVGPAKFLGICATMLEKWKDVPDALHLDIRASASANLGAVAMALGLDPVGAGASVDFAVGYERAIVGVKRPYYGGLNLVEGAPDLVGAIPAHAMGGKALRPEFHVTLRFLGDIMDPIWYMDFLSKIGTAVDFTVTEIVWDDKCVVARVALPDGVVCASTTPHITLALAEGLKPAYSATLLDRADAPSLEVHVPVKGVHAFG